MKNKYYICLLLSMATLLSIFFTSCKGSAGKKAATEALELIEKRGGSKAASTIEREASQVEKATTREAEEYGGSRFRTSRPRHHSYGDDESSYQHQTYSVTCSQCGGAGAVYMVDYYGNIQWTLKFLKLLIYAHMRVINTLYKG